MKKQNIFLFTTSYYKFTIFIGLLLFIFLSLVLILILSFNDYKNIFLIKEVKLYILVSTIIFSLLFSEFGKNWLEILAVFNLCLLITCLIFQIITQ
jgi:hypothetical protein